MMIGRFYGPRSTIIVNVFPLHRMSKARDEKQEGQMAIVKRISNKK
jgi:hypothetical protein